MKKAMILILNIPLLFFSCLFVGSTRGAETSGPDLVSQYALIYNCDENRIVYEKNADERMYPASLTKIITVSVALEQESDLNQFVTIQPEALQGLAEANASVAGFVPLDQVRFMDLLYGAMLPSGADATSMIAYHIAGSEDAFVDLMNEKAQALQLQHTHFMNASGLHDPDHYSSAHDLLILLQDALKKETFYEIYTSDFYATEDWRYQFEPTASKMAASAGIDPAFIKGAKTGFTLEGGLCFSFLSEVNEATYLVILGNAGNDMYSYQHIKDANQTYQYLKEHYTMKTYHPTGEKIGSAPIRYGNDDEVEFCVHEDIRLLTKDDQSSETIELLQETFTAPIAENDVIAELVIDNDGEQHRYTLYAMKSVERDWFAYLLQAWWLYGLIVLVTLYVLYRKYGAWILGKGKVMAQTTAKKAQSAKGKTDGKHPTTIKNKKNAKSNRSVHSSSADKAQSNIKKRIQTMIKQAIKIKNNIKKRIKRLINERFNPKKKG